MSRSPLAYPLTRGIDGESGGAADLQTDIMRFMAILALCLVAIFALVQSLPMAPVQAEPVAAVPDPPVAEPVMTEPEPVPDPVPVVQQQPEPVVERPEPVPVAEDEPPVTLTRPRWVTTFTPATPVEVTRPDPAPAPREPAPAAQPQPVVEAAPPAPAPEQVGFTLRFESDLALTRLVAAGQVGFYAIDDGRAQRMSVSDSRISFWDASTPSSFHEMEASTVPGPVIDALARSGADTHGVSWGVTLPRRLSNQLDTLMREHTGGELVIHGSGDLRLESS